MYKCIECREARIDCQESCPRMAVRGASCASRMRRKQCSRQDLGAKGAAEVFLARGNEKDTCGPVGRRKCHAERRRGRGNHYIGPPQNRSAQSARQCAEFGAVLVLFRQLLLEQLHSLLIGIEISDNSSRAIDENTRGITDDTKGRCSGTKGLLVGPLAIRRRLA